jgi:hypothetical protein
MVICVFAEIADRLLVIDLALFPAAKDDPDPFVSHRADRGWMGLLLLALAVAVLRSLCGPPCKKGGEQE